MNVLGTNKRIQALLLSSTLLWATSSGSARGADENFDMPKLRQGPPSGGMASGGADPAPYVTRLEDNTRNVLLKLIELERYNLNYKMTVAKQGRWKGWRYFTFTQTNNGLSLGGSLVGMVERTQHFRTPNKLNIHRLERGNIITGVGSIIGASGSIMEMGINGYHEYETHKKGFAPATARKKVRGILDDINNLFVEREALVKTLNSNCGCTKYEMLSRAEDAVLLDIRDISLDEFKRFHSGARRTLAFQQSLYTIDIGRNVTGALASRFGFLALKTGNRHNNTVAGVMSDISGGLTVLNPFVSRGIGKLVGEYHKHYIRNCTKDSRHATVETLASDLEHLKIVANTPELEQADLPVLRTALYSEHENGVRKQLNLADAELRNGVLAAQQQVVSGTLLGGAKIAAGGVLFNIAGVRFPHNGKRTNIYLGTAGIINTAAASYALLDNLRIQLKREYDYHKLKKKHALPGQIIKDRLAQLDSMEKGLVTPPSTSYFKLDDQEITFTQPQVQLSTSGSVMDGLVSGNALSTSLPDVIEN